MGLLVQRKALQAASGLRELIPLLGLQLAVAYGYFASSALAEVDRALDEVCAMSWRLSGR